MICDESMCPIGQRSKLLPVTMAYTAEEEPTCILGALLLYLVPGYT
jgi:hypothetical protein